MDRIDFGAIFLVILVAIAIVIGLSHIKPEQKQLCTPDAKCITVWSMSSHPNDNGCFRFYLNEKLSAESTICGTYQIK